jgi:hypothetical protein
VVFPYNSTLEEIICERKNSRANEVACQKAHDHGCDTPVESFVVHSLNIGQLGYSYEGSHALFLIFLSYILYV